MIDTQQSGLFDAGNAQYAGFGAFIAVSYLSSPITPPSGGSDAANQVRVGIVRGGYVSDGNVGIGGEF